MKICEKRVAPGSPVSKHDAPEVQNLKLRKLSKKPGNIGGGYTGAANGVGPTVDNVRVDEGQRSQVLSTEGFGEVRGE